MENFYKITKAQADLIGRFDYSANESVDPYCSEQKDGTFLISEKIYKLLKERPEIKKVDFTKLTLIEKESIDLKNPPSL